MKKILVPVNFTDYSDNAALFAAHFAKSYDANIVLFHSNHIPVNYPDVAPESIQILSDEADTVTKQRLEELKMKLLESEPHLECTIDYTNTTGLDSEEILDAVHRTHCDMLVMGTHHTESISRFLLGSTFSTILEKTKVPVLVIPANLKHYLPIRTIVFALDHDSEVNVLHIDDALEFARKLQAKLVCVHVDLVGKKVDGIRFNSLKEKFEPLIKLGVINFQKIIANDVIEGLNAFTEQEQGDMKVMIKRKRSAIQEMAVKSLSKKMAYNTPTPLLIMPG